MSVIAKTQISPEAKRLSVVFKDYGGTQKSFAEILDVTQGSVSRMLKSEYPITLKVAKAVCYKLGYTPDWFLRGEGPKKNKGEKACKLIMDISELKTDIDIVNTRIDILASRLKYTEDLLEEKSHEFNKKAM
ncbi:MAG TPA: helix-turn-helix transcriptional regulator [Mucilaginibacter sp.]|jgi:transcriptional regulator with XRE-family HTH domain